MKNKSKQNIILLLVIALLILFNGMQLYGIFSDEPIIVPQKKQNKNSPADTSFVPLQINVLNGCGINGVGTAMTTYCRSIGYDVVEMGNYKSFDVEHSLVIDRSGKNEEAVRLARQLGISPNNVVKQFSTEHLVTASVVIGKDYKELRPWK